MLKLIKWFAGLLVTLTVLILLAIIVIPQVVDPNDYRDELSALVKDKTGRDLTLSGDLKISVFPWLGVKTQGLSLSQPDGIEGNMLSVDTAQLRVKLMPLLSKKIELDTVVLERPIIKFVTLKNGMDSFSGLTEDAASEELEKDSATTAVALAIQGVKLTDGTVIIDDRQAGSVVQLTNLNVVTGNLIGLSLADINASGLIKNSASPGITKFDVNARALIDTDTFDVQASDMLAKIQQGEFDIELAMEEMTFKQSSLLDASGLSLTVKGAQALEATIPQLRADLNAQTASVDTLDANYQNVNVIVSNLSIKKFIDQPIATGRLTVPTFDARELIKRLQIDFKPSDPKALQSVGLSADFSASLEAAQTQNLLLNLDNTSLSGSASVVNFEKPRIMYDLSLSDLNLDSYLPEAVDGEEEVSGGEALAVPMAVFSQFDANGAFKASKLVSGGVTLTDIDVVVESSPGRVSITPRAKLYDGKLDGAIVFTESVDKKSLTVKNQIDLVQLSPLLSDAVDSDMLRGIGTLVLDLVVTEINGVQSHEGTIQLRAKEGALSGFDIYNIVAKLNNAADLYSSLSGSDQPPSETAKVQGKKSDNTEFSELLGTFYLKDFLMTNDDLSFKGPGFEITGEGKFDLQKEHLDYRLKLIIQEAIASAGGDTVQKLLGPKLSWLSGKQIPIRCSGEFERPVCLPDVKALYSFYLSSKLNDKKSQLLQDELGIQGEEGKSLRTKDILKQLILKEWTKDGDIEGSESREVPIGERDAELNPEDGQDSTDPVREKTKKELRDERKRKLSEGLFQ
ncbi:MAG: AsmA family protein [Arenicella sp.]|nr:AsmA family protein [Arenicella sp.]